MTLTDRCAALSLPMRRVVALGVLPLCALGAALLLGWPLQQAWLAQQRWRLETEQLLTQAAGAEAAREALTHQIEALRASPLQAQVYQGGGAMSPAAQLQAEVDAVMSSVQASSRSLAPVPVSEAPPLLRYGVRVSASLRLDQLQGVLNALARHARLLRVEQLSISAPQAQGPTENPPLAVTMEIYAYAIAIPMSAPAMSVAAASERPR